MEASESCAETSSAQTSPIVRIARIDSRRIVSIRRPIAPDSVVAGPRIRVGKTRSFDTIVASAVESTIAIDAAALTPPSSAAARTKPKPSAAGSSST